MTREAADALVLARIGAALRVMRTQRSLSQAQLADRAGLQPSYVAGVERGERNATVLTLAKLLRALDATPTTLAKALDRADSTR